MWFFLVVVLWAILFCCSYACMCWRRTECNIHYNSYDTDPALLVSIFVPPFGIVWGLMDVALHRIGLR